MGEESSSGEPIDVLLKSTRDLLRPEELVREATRDIVKDEIRRHLEKTLHDDPKLAQDLREAVRDLLAARATRVRGAGSGRHDRGPARALGPAA